MTATYLETLNREQRRAVEHGVQKKNAAPAAALLVIAGAGSGKTNTVAHRVAHLIVHGTDPRRILLMTFSTAKEIHGAEVKHPRRAPSRGVRQFGRDTWCLRGVPANNRLLHHRS